MPQNNTTLLQALGAVLSAAVGAVGAFFVASRQKDASVLPAEMTLIVEAWQYELARLRPLVTALDEERIKLKAEIARLSDENNELKTHMVSLKRDLEELRAQVSR